MRDDKEVQDALSQLDLEKQRSEVKELLNGSDQNKEEEKKENETTQN